MSDDEDEVCRFGTALDPIKEDEVPSKKPITIADQIAVDSNGRRRFHGAFTGGFSAGFWNTVGSQEGWTPQSFKSSRNEKAAHAVQKPNDFMDDEDIGEFGIAPQRIQTREDFTPADQSHPDEKSNRNKRKLHKTSDGPIPGVPVLHLVLESCRDKTAVRLLKQMDTKSGQSLNRKSKEIKVNKDESISADVAAEDTNVSDATAENNGRVYMCDMGPIQRRKKLIDDTDDDEDDDEYDLEFTPDEFDAFAASLKTDRFGLDYSGLDRNAFFGTTSDAAAQSKHINLFSAFEMVDKNNKKISIKGQAFGVGAFEEDDDDIYAKDDMSKYDFQMGDKSAKEKSKLKSIQSAQCFIDGFTDVATQATGKQLYKKIFTIDLPRSYEPRNWLKRRTRFGPQVQNSDGTISDVQPPKIVGRHDLTPAQRGLLLNEKADSNIAQERKPFEADSLLKAAGLKPMSFVSDSEQKNSTSESNEIEIIAIDTQPRALSPSLAESIDNIVDKMDVAVRSIPFSKVFTPPESVPQIFDRFVTEGDKEHIDLTENASAPVNVEEKAEEIKVIRTKTVWKPCQMLCYKMNIESAVGAKPDNKPNTFSLFSCLTEGEPKKKPLQFTSTGEFLQDAENEEAKQKQSERENVHRSSVANVSSIPSTSSDAGLNKKKNPFKSDKTPLVPVKRDNVKKNELELKIIDAQDKHPSQKKDIFKAIFESSDDDNDDAIDEKETIDNNTKSIDIISNLTRPSIDYPTLPDAVFMPKSAREINILRNTSPPRGIFSGLLNQIISEQSIPIKETVEEPKQSTDKSIECYGPSLPPILQRQQSSETISSDNNKFKATTSVASIATNNGTAYKIYLEEQWIEKNNKKEKKSKKEKKEKKHKKKNKKEKHRSSSHHRDREKKSKRKQI